MAATHTISDSGSSDDDDDDKGGKTDIMVSKQLKRPLDSANLVRPVGWPKPGDSTKPGKKQNSFSENE